MHFALQTQTDKENGRGNNEDDENVDPVDGCTQLQ